MFLWYWLISLRWYLLYDSHWYAASCSPAPSDWSIEFDCSTWFYYSQRRRGPCLGISVAQQISFASWKKWSWCDYALRTPRPSNRQAFAFLASPPPSQRRGHSSDFPSPAVQSRARIASCWDMWQCFEAFVEATLACLLEQPLRELAGSSAIVALEIELWVSSQGCRAFSSDRPRPCQDPSTSEEDLSPSAFEFSPFLPWSCSWLGSTWSAAVFLPPPFWSSPGGLSGPRQPSQCGCWR